MAISAGKTTVSSLFHELCDVRHDLAVLAERDALLEPVVKRCDELLMDLEAVRDYRRSQGKETE